MDKYYRLEFNDGPFNGGFRYFKFLTSAIHAGESYVKDNKDYPDRVGFDIYFITLKPYSCTRVFSL